ncbi:MAG: diaminopimelate decarboxylase [Elusimicrobiota bacterium]|jgi:diaminopimelate decarboxylase|nr:diaminopimelate decarboxylase [Elusimicrobiota bacterium]
MLNFVDVDLYIEKIKLSDIAKKYGTAVFVYSKKKIVDNFANYKKALNKKKGLICFACKANSNGKILEILAKLGAGADTTSGGEIFRCLKAGFSASKIVYAGVGKTSEEIEYALKNKILMFNVESLEELDTINNIAAKLKAKAKIAFRINPHVDPDTHQNIATGKKGTKFGIDYNEAVEAYDYAKTKKNIIISGIHFHIGSQILDIRPYEAAAQKIQKIILQLQKNGIKIEYVNIGGGLGIAYEKWQEYLLPHELAETVLPIFDKNKKIIFEPGRSIIADAGHLLSKVIYRKFSGEKNFIIVDAGMNDLVRPALYGSYHEIVPIKKSNINNKIKTDIVGPICESGDFMGKDRTLSLLEQGDFLLIKNTGAYGFAMSSQYNSRPMLPEVLVDKDKATLIRKRGTFKDLLLNEV